MHDEPAQRTGLKSSSKFAKIALTPDELYASGLIPIGRSGIYRGLRDGSIPSIKVGKKFIIPIAAIEAWMKTAVGNVAV